MEEYKLPTRVLKNALEAAFLSGQMKELGRDDIEAEDVIETILLSINPFKQ